MTDRELQELGSRLLAYCNKFDVPVRFLFDILEDQKVTPMIRGKAMEYNAFLLLESLLPGSVWSVQKLNLNPQPGTIDEDISITHRRSGVILKVESKSSVRGSMSDGSRARVLKCPHFKVKCHRSRSNISLAGTTNDKYPVGFFDVLLTTPLNAIFKGNTIGETLEVIEDTALKNILYEHYHVNNDLDLIAACAIDWRYCMPEDIAVNGFIPRTPYVSLSGDPHWRSISELNARLSVDIERLRRNIPSRRS